eukprot:GHVP01026617.1.p1 GENE.GHVP01026617.1~~GHVP01026617.1.p1  ORF type:complete len:118 (+),score=16.52 GHVP01026617.1:397-750(+)
MLGASVGVYNPLVPETDWEAPRESISVETIGTSNPKGPANCSLAVDGFFDLPRLYSRNNAVNGEEEDGQIMHDDHSDCEKKDNTDSDDEIEIMMDEREKALEKLKLGETSGRRFLRL